MTKRRFNERQTRLMRALARAKADADLPVIGSAPISNVLQYEADQPMQGGDADLQHDGLFGDGHLQTELLKPAGFQTARKAETVVNPSKSERITQWLAP